MLSLVEQQSRESEAFVESNHRIANHLSLVVSILRLEKESVPKTVLLTREKAAAVLDECGRRIDSIARVHRLLAHSPPRSSSLELGEYLLETARRIISGISTDERIALQFDCAEPFHVPPEDAVSLGLMVGELVTNSVKYAHPSGVRGCIGLLCRREADGTIVVAVCDDGVGFPEGFDVERERGSVGFRLIWSLAQRLRAKIEFDNSCLGLVVTIRVPVQKPPSVHGISHVSAAKS